MIPAAMRLPFARSALHTSDRPSSTAQWTTLGRALELNRSEPIVTDRYAPVFLSETSRVLWRTLSAAGPAFRQAERLELLGLATSALCRHRFIDEHLLAALPDVQQVMVLGAGYDARAYRFATQIGARPVYEVDLPPLSRRKAAVVAGHREVFGHTSVHRVEIDFRTQALTDRLAGSGFTTGAPTFVVWEGVSPYLTRAAVDDTLAALSRVCGTGSVVAMDFWQRVGGFGVYEMRLAVERSMRLIGEPIGFTVTPASVETLLGAHGFELIDVADGAEMTARWATGGRTCDRGLYVVAARLA